MLAGHGAIRILHPGQAVSETDTGIGGIGRIDHAEINTNTAIRLHPHVNDEILSYFRTGTSLHSASVSLNLTCAEDDDFLLRSTVLAEQFKKVSAHTRCAEIDE
jgi:hypothetical protein